MQGPGIRPGDVDPQIYGAIELNGSGDHYNEAHGSFQLSEAQLWAAKREEGQQVAVYVTIASFAVDCKVCYWHPVPW